MGFSSEVKVEKDAEDIIENSEGKMESFFKRITKRSAAHAGPEVEQLTSGKRVKVTTQVRRNDCNEKEHLLQSQLQLFYRLNIVFGI